MTPIKQLADQTFDVSGEMDTRTGFNLIEFTQCEVWHMKMFVQNFINRQTKWTNFLVYFLKDF